jgi:ubiquinone/menaquinone biosynthesis C-methylase UbiE
LDREAWENYWTDGRASGSVGCLPDSTPELERLQNDFWRRILLPLARKSTVVDLATGDGAVLNAISTFRKDLRLIGVDYASKLPKAKPRVKLLPNVDMEDLPFADGSIDAFVSRFGIEYGDVTRIGRELARTLGPNGRFAFIMHNSASPSYEINSARSQQLTWRIHTGCSAYGSRRSR